MESASSAVKTSCLECGSEELLLKKREKGYCSICWRHHCEFKFRKKLLEIGRPEKGTTGKVFKPAENVLLVYDGSPSSVALINLALNAMTFGKRLQNDVSTPNLPFPFRFTILVILESELNGSPGVEGRQKKHLQSLLKWSRFAERIANGVSFPVLTSCLEMSVKEYHPPEANNYMGFDKSPIVIRLLQPTTIQVEDAQSTPEPESIARVHSVQVEALGLPFNLSLDHHLMEIRRSLKTKTEDKDFIAILKKNLVRTIADDLEISKIILPEDQTSLAVKMFSMMSLGRGCQIADEMSFISQEDTGPLFARPLIEFSDDDLRFYIDTIEDESTDGIVNKGGAKRKMKIDSVERQCDDFISNLQKGYPSTVSTLTRIGGKLQSQPNLKPSNSKSTSTTAPDNDNEVSIMSCRFCKRQAEANSCPEEGIFLCYGCQHFLNDAHPDKKQLFKNLFLLKTQDT